MDLDVLGIVRIGTKPAQPEPFNDRRLPLERREGRVGAAAFGHVAITSVLPISLGKRLVGSPKRGTCEMPHISRAGPSRNFFRADCAS